MFRRKILAGLVALFAAASAGGYAAYEQWQREQREIAALLATVSEDSRLIIPRGTSLAKIAEAAAGKLPIDAAMFVALSRREKVAKRLQAGVYHLRGGQTVASVLQDIASGKIVQEKITLIEGKTFNDWRAQLAADTRLRKELPGMSAAAILAALNITLRDGAAGGAGAAGDGAGAAGAAGGGAAASGAGASGAAAGDGGDAGDSIAAAAAAAAVGAAAGNENAALEGLFLPDTYFFQPGDSDLSILRRAHQHLAAVLEKHWAGRKTPSPLGSPYDALVLASVVEKETGKADERPLIASVFLNRLRKRIRLQADPTVIYGLGSAFDGNLTRAHLRKIDTPYNTYLRGGLPPTPIAMPSEAAIRAVLAPAQSEYYYFVAKGDGSHYFSATLREHNNAVNRYQRRRRR